MLDGMDITFLGNSKNGPATVGGVTFPQNHEGHSGWTIKQIDDIVQDGTALKGTPNIVLLHIGTNDLNGAAGGGLSGAQTRLSTLIDHITAKVPDALVVVAKLIPLPGKAADLTTYNGQVATVVKDQASKGKHVIIVDQFTGFPTANLPDSIHPDKAGYVIMGKTWYTVIKPYLVDINSITL